MSSLENRTSGNIDFKGETKTFTLIILKIFHFISETVSNERYKTDIFCVGGRFYSSTKGIEGDLTKCDRKKINKSCVQCKGIKTMIDSDSTIQTQRLGKFYKNLGKSCERAGRKLATNRVKNPGRAMETGQQLVVQLYLKIQKRLYYYPRCRIFLPERKRLYLGKTNRKQAKSQNL